MDKNIIIKLGVPAIIFVVLGSILSKYIPTYYLEIGICMVLTLVAIFLLIYSEKGLELNNRNLITSGIFSGFFAGAIGSGGAIRGLALTSLQVDKSILISTSAVIDLGVDFSRAVVYYFNGFISARINSCRYHWQLYRKKTLGLFKPIKFQKTSFDDYNSYVNIAAI